MRNVKNGETYAFSVERAAVQFTGHMRTQYRGSRSFRPTNGGYKSGYYFVKFHNFSKIGANILIVHISEREKP